MGKNKPNRHDYRLLIAEADAVLLPLGFEKRVKPNSTDYTFCIIVPYQLGVPDETFEVPAISEDDQHILHEANLMLDIPTEMKVVVPNDQKEAMLFSVSIDHCNCRPNSDQVIIHFDGCLISTPDNASLNDEIQAWRKINLDPLECQWLTISGIHAIGHAVATFIPTMKTFLERKIPFDQKGWMTCLADIRTEHAKKKRIYDTVQYVLTCLKAHQSK